MDAVSFENVDKYYGDFHALKDISFKIPKNSIVGLIGANGSGKTTIIKCMLNYFEDYSGEIKVFGRDSKDVFQKDNAFSYVPDKAVYYEELTVEEHFDFISKMYGTEEKISKLVEEFELKSHLCYWEFLYLV